MILTAERFAGVLQGFGLAQGIYKPFGSFADKLPLFEGDTAKASVPNTQVADFGPAGAGIQGQQTPPLVVQLDGTSNSTCSVSPYELSDIGPQAFPPFNTPKAIIYRYRQQQSVNLGSW